MRRRKKRRRKEEPISGGGYEELAYGNDREVDLVTQLVPGLLEAADVTARVVTN
jgi:hypothetical protein